MTSSTLPDCLLRGRSRLPLHWGVLEELPVRETDQRMTKLRLRRLWEEILDADLIQVDVEEDEESHSDQREPVKRVTVVVRYIPA